VRLKKISNFASLPAGRQGTALKNPNLAYNLQRYKQKVTFRVAVCFFSKLYSKI
jgi:hypothetical protein